MVQKHHVSEGGARVVDWTFGGGRWGGDVRPPIGLRVWCCGLCCGSVGVEGAPPHLTSACTFSTPPPMGHKKYALRPLTRTGNSQGVELPSLPLECAFLQKRATLTACLNKLHA